MTCDYSEILNSNPLDLYPEKMNSTYFFSTNEHLETLEIVSNFWTQHYNFLLGLDSFTEDEKDAFYDDILSEKVFDV